MKKTNKLLICTTVAIAVFLIVGFFPVHGESKIYDTVVRLHVLANSDSEQDQALKLEVRDEIIKIISPSVENCHSIEEAIAAIGSVMDDIQTKAEEVVSKRGYDYAVSIKIGKEHYPTKEYESCCFPAGEYVSLQVLLGEAEGQNWWCCLFPPLCLSAASEQARLDNEDAFISAGLNADQYKIITDSDKTKYKVRFKILEVIEGIFK